MITNLVYRSATLDDASAIARVHLQAWKESYVGLIEQEYLDSISFSDRLKLRRNMLTTANSKKLNLVVLHNEKIIGFCDAGPCFTPSSDYKGEVYAIYLLNEYKHLGIGTELIQMAKKHLVEQELTPFIVWVLAENKSACRFYEKCKGFVFQRKHEWIGSVQYQEIGYLYHVQENSN
ncbi:MAG: GNAT family N-acetyltransferase [Pseudomonadota bacterium]